MTAAIRKFSLLLPALLLAGCSGALAPGDGGRPQTVTLGETLQEIEQLEAPAGVDSQSFGALKGALKAALEATGQGGFTVHPPRGPNSVVTDLTLALLPGGEQGIQWTYVNPGDYNFDGQTNSADIVQLALHFGADSRSPNWDRAQYVDGDRNGAITIADITTIAANFLGTVSAWQVESASSEEGPFDAKTQIGLAEGETKADLTPPHFRSLAPEGEFFRVLPVGPDGTQGQYSFVSKPIQLRPNIHAVDSDNGPYLLSRNGYTLTLGVSGATMVNAGDLLVYGADGGFVLKVDEIVAAGTTVTASCSPSNIGELVSRGYFNVVLYDSSLAGSAIHGSFNDVSLCDEPTLQIKASGDYEASGLRALVAASFDNGGLELARTELQVDQLNFAPTLSVEGQAYHGTFPLNAFLKGNYEKLIAVQSLAGAVEVAPGLLIPIQAKVQVIAGVGGGGEIDGNHLLSYNSIGYGIVIRSEYDAENGVWSHNSSYGIEGGAATDNQMPGSGNFVLAPYLRTQLSIELLPGMAGKLDAPSIQFEVVAEATQQAEHVDLPTPGYSFQEEGWLDRSAGISLRIFGLPAAVSTSWKGASTGPVYLRNGFAPDPVAAPHSVSGFITRDSEVFPGVTVTAYESGTSNVLGSATTDGEGYYVIFGIAAGTVVDVVPDYEFHYFTPASVTLALDADKTQDFNGTLYSFSMQGLIRDMEGFPLAGMRVEFFEQGSLALLGEVFTDGDGFYSFPVNAGTLVRIVPTDFYFTFSPEYIEHYADMHHLDSFTGMFGSG